MKAHQRRIRDRLALVEPRPTLPSLAGCVVEAITPSEAQAIILKYEWLGTMNRKPLACYGLRGPDGALLGVASFGMVGAPEAHDLCGREYRKQTIALERGACVHWAPKNSASFMIRHACRLAYREHGWSVFFAYADPAAGEIGTVYQASNWSYLGQGTGRTGPPYREEWRKPGGSIWHSERILRHQGLKKAQALALGWHYRRRALKHRYAWFEDAAMVDRCRYAFLPYPKRLRLVRSEQRAADRAGRCCLVCAQPVTAQRSTRTTCSTACRVKLYRDRLRGGPRRVGRYRNGFLTSNYSLGIIG